MPDAEGRFCVAIVGSRDYFPDDEVWAVVERMRERHPEGIRVVTGDARGVDRVAAQQAGLQGVPFTIEEAHWPPPDAPPRDKYAAGSERNARVVAQADVLVAFFHPGPASDLAMTSSGTMNAVAAAKGRGIPVYTFHEGKWFTGDAPRAPSLPPEGWTVPRGYRASSTTSTCGNTRRAGCGAAILWAETPRGRKVPLNPDGTSHHSTCPTAAQERRRDATAR